VRPTLYYYQVGSLDKFPGPLSNRSIRISGGMRLGCQRSCSLSKVSLKHFAEYKLRCLSNGEAHLEKSSSRECGVDSFGNEQAELP
jgi:hypothetical protein